jgi:hypothetical protein
LSGNPWRKFKNKEFLLTLQFPKDITKAFYLSLIVSLYHILLWSWIEVLFARQGWEILDEKKSHYSLFSQLINILGT